MPTSPFFLYHHLLSEVFSSQLRCYPSEMYSKGTLDPLITLYLNVLFCFLLNFITLQNHVFINLHF